MPALKFDRFAGTIPRISNRLIDPRNAITANNLKPFSGELRSWARPLKVTTATKASSGTVQSIYRLTDGVTDYWLNWLTDVDAVPGPLAGDTSRRIYYTGDNSPKKTNLSLATSGADYPFDHYEMGLPAPTVPSVSVTTAGSAPNSARTYVVTFYNGWGEEGPPSPVSASVTFGATGFTVALSAIDTGKKTCTIVRSGSTATATCAGHGLRDKSKATMSGATQPEYNGTFVITVIDPNTFTFQVTGTPATPATGAPLLTKNYNITGRRIYRSLVGSNGLTAYQRLADIPDTTTTTYTDTTVDTGLGVVAPTFDPYTSGSAWLEPPEALRGLIDLPGNGCAGFYANVLCFSEPGYPHAWPLRYQLTFPFAVVGIKAYGNTVVVATAGIPYVVTGTHPSNMSAAKIEDLVEPAVSKRGMADGIGGVFYPSPNGLMGGGLGGFANVTEALFTGGKTGEWQTRAFPSSLIGVIYDGRYYGFYTDTLGVRAGFVLPKGGDVPGVCFVSLAVTAAIVDRQNGKFYIVQGGDIYEWDGDPYNLTPFEWLSKEVCLPEPVNYGYFLIEADFAQLADQAVRAAAAAAAAAANTVILAGAETWPKTGKTKGEIDGAMWNTYVWNGSSLIEQPSNAINYDARSLTFQAIAEVDGALQITHSETITDRSMRTMTADVNSDVWRFRIVGNIPVYSLKVATSPKALKTV